MPSQILIASSLVGQTALVLRSVTRWPLLDTTSAWLVEMRAKCKRQFKRSRRNALKSRQNTSYLILLSWRPYRPMKIKLVKNSNKLISRCFSWMLGTFRWVHSRMCHRMKSSKWRQSILSNQFTHSKFWSTRCWLVKSALLASSWLQSLRVPHCQAWLHTARQRHSWILWAKVSTLNCAKRSM